ncbi:leucine-rich repeat extensin-like protein 1 [Asterias rubens]|uniref:leucine-rich repeat extensin-like protein 1 n=1 Tax=Asterias rubens TaxID=7604 RepID=UPI001455B568|nr:leucine-rich repeat extensin-like protein 1 [Asterias rubens]
MSVDQDTPPLVDSPSPTPEPDPEPEPELSVDQDTLPPVQPPSPPPEPEARYPTRNRQPPSVLTYDQMGTPTQQFVAPVLASPVDPRYAPVPHSSYPFPPTLPMYPPDLHPGQYLPAPIQYYPQQYGQGWMPMSRPPVPFNPLIQRH